MHRIRTRFLARFAAVALLAVAAGQLALAGHAVAADHDVGERCEVCLGGERLSHALTQAAAAIELPAASHADAVAPITAIVTVAPTGCHARAPPIL